MERAKETTGLERHVRLMSGLCNEEGENKSRKKEQKNEKQKSGRAEG